MIVQTEDKDLVRDSESRALLSTNRTALQERKVRREHAQRITNLENGMAEVKSLTLEILSLLKETRT